MNEIHSLFLIYSFCFYCHWATNRTASHAHTQGNFVDMLNPQVFTAEKTAEWEQQICQGIWNMSRSVKVPLFAWRSPFASLQQYSGKIKNFFFFFEILYFICTSITRKELNQTLYKNKVLFCFPIWFLAWFIQYYSLRFTLILKNFFFAQEAKDFSQREGVYRLVCVFISQPWHPSWNHVSFGFHSRANFKLGFLGHWIEAA